MRIWILFDYAGYSQQFEFIVMVARWPLLALLVLGLLALLYRYRPCRPAAKWQWVSAGSVFATLVWLLASAAFSFYGATHKPRQRADSAGRAKLPG
jgi:membrane protein